MGAAVGGLGVRAYAELLLLRTVVGVVVVVAVRIVGVAARLARDGSARGLGGPRGAAADGEHGDWRRGWVVERRSQCCQTPAMMLEALPALPFAGECRGLF